MKKIFLFLIFLSATLIVSWLLFFNYSIYLNKLGKVEINGKEFKVEIVKSPEKIKKGLSGRSELCRNCGMLFEFSERKKLAFWMKGMKFSLDIIWIDKGRVVYVAKNISYDYEGTIIPEIEASEVLEINGGESDKIGIREGSQVIFK